MMLRARFLVRRFSTTQSRNVLPFEDTAEDYDLKKEYPVVHLEKFYDEISSFKLSDADAIEYMTFAAKLSCLKFKSQQEMLQYKSDFQSALAFIQKLDDVDVSGVEPLGNVWEYYRGNETRLRREHMFDTEMIFERRQL